VKYNIKDNTNLTKLKLIYMRDTFEKPVGKKVSQTVYESREKCIQKKNVIGWDGG
jgi:hypothetical protein